MRVWEHLRGGPDRSLNLSMREKLSAEEERAWQAILREYRRHAVTSMFKANVRKIVQSPALVCSLIRKGYLRDAGAPTGAAILTIPH